MAWVTRLAESDYTVQVVGTSILFHNTRIGRGYKLTPTACERLYKTLGSRWNSNQLIQAAINAALIPHPYDEYQ